MKAYGLKPFCLAAGTAAVIASCSSLLVNALPSVPRGPTRRADIPLSKPFKVIFASTRESGITCTSEDQGVEFGDEGDGLTTTTTAEFEGVMTGPDDKYQVFGEVPFHFIPNGNSVRVDISASKTGVGHQTVECHLDFSEQPQIDNVTYILPNLVMFPSGGTLESFKPDCSGDMIE